MKVEWDWVGAGVKTNNFLYSVIKKLVFYGGGRQPQINSFPFIDLLKREEFKLL